MVYIDSESFVIHDFGFVKVVLMLIDVRRRQILLPISLLINNNRRND
jgi:hypothetical protein